MLNRLSEKIYTEMIKIYFHLATMGEYQVIHDELIQIINESNLLNENIMLKVCVVGDGFLHKKHNEKISYLNVGNINQYEFPTLQEIENDIEKIEQNFKILYINGLGVTDNSVYKKSWRSYLSHFNITHFRECLNSLDNGYDVCGVDWRTDPVPHYSGNFWWANSEYVKTLPKISTLNQPNSPRVLTLRHNAEMFIGMSNKVTPRILHQSDISQYERHLHTYDSEKYLNKINYENVVKKR